MSWCEYVLRSSESALGSSSKMTKSKWSAWLKSLYGVPHNLCEERLGYVCNPRSLKEGTETSRRMTDELGSRQRDLSTSSVTKRANGHWHAIIASSCRWSQREYKRQPVHRINHVFAEEPSRRPGRPAVVQQLWRRDVTSPFPPSGNEGYIRNRDVPFQSVTPSHVGWPTNWDPYQSATGAAPSSALCRPPDPSYKADDRTGLHREGRLLLSLATQTVGLE